MGKGKRIAAILAGATLIFGVAPLSACGGKPEPDSYAGLVERREELWNELKKVDDQINDMLSRTKDVDEIKKAVNDLKSKVQYESVNAPEVLAEIDSIIDRIASLQDSGIIDEMEAGGLYTSLELVRKGVFYSVAAQGIESRVAADPLMETREVKRDGDTFKEQTAVNFGSLQLVTNEVNSADMLYSSVTAISDGLKRSCIVGESYSEEAGEVSKKAFVEEFKSDMKSVIYAASDLSYDINEGYKVVSTADYYGKDQATTIVFDVDEKGKLESLDQTFEAGGSVTAEISVEYSSITASYFSSLLDRAQKTLDQQQTIFAEAEKQE